MLRSFIYVFISIFFVSLVCHAENLTLGGTVTGPEGQALANAEVILAANGSNLTRTVTTNTAGAFEFVDLTAGNYVIYANAAGLQSISKDITLQPGESIDLHLELNIKELEELVTITADMLVELGKVPGSTALVEEVQIENSRANNLKDVLDLTPGVFAQPRFGADETQFSIRGSGLRNNFHMRGLNILVNGIPYQDADGFSDFETIDLMATQHIEIWKGANALRYGGNSMGGAINFVTNTGEAESPFKVRLNGGSYGFLKGQISSGGVKDSFDYYLSFSDTEMDGYRDHSEQSRRRLFGNFGWKLSDSTRLKMDIVYANVSETLPGSLTREQFLSDPRQADPNNVQGDWGRDYDYARTAMWLTQQLNANHQIEFVLYGQYRDMVHPIFQILDQDGRNFGAEVRYLFEGQLAGRNNRFVAGFSPQYGKNGERRYRNINGEAGDTVAVFNAIAQNYGLYFENQFDWTPELTLITGGRVDALEREFEDQFPADGIRSDERTFDAFSPKIGILWKPRVDAQIFANASRSYEAPLLLELTSFGAPGFLDLEAQDTWQFEIGSRGNHARWNWDVSFYDAEIENEIININVQPFPFAPFTIPSYRNAEQTRHLGLELGSGFLVGQNLFASEDEFIVRAAYTYSRFRFVDDDTFSGNQIPGAPEHLFRGELNYQHPNGFWIAPAIDWSPSDYFMDSANTDKNDSYLVLNLKGGYKWEQFRVFVEASNLTDELYSGSVQVDSATKRYFEPSNGRSVYLGVQWEY
jgi:iron complex outermembrane receptor protein